MKPRDMATMVEVAVEQGRSTEGLKRLMGILDRKTKERLDRGQVIRSELNPERSIMKVGKVYLMEGGPYGPHSISGDSTAERIVAHWEGYKAAEKGRAN